MKERAPKVETYTRTYQPTLSEDGKTCVVSFPTGSYTFVRENDTVRAEPPVTRTDLQGEERTAYTMALNVARGAFSPLSPEMLTLTSRRPGTTTLPRVITKAPRQMGADELVRMKSVINQADTHARRNPDPD